MDMYCKYYQLKNLATKIIQVGAISTDELETADIMASFIYEIARVGYDLSDDFIDKMNHRIEMELTSCEAIEQDLEEAYMQSINPIQGE